MIQYNTKLNNKYTRLPAAIVRPPRGEGQGGRPGGWPGRQGGAWDSGLSPPVRTAGA